jgi:hypothetical protein
LGKPRCFGSNLRLDLLCQRRRVRKLQVLLEILVKVFEIQFREVDYLKLIDGDGSAIWALCATEADAQLPTPALLLDYLGQLGVEHAVAALLLNADAQDLFGTVLTNSNGELALLSGAQGFLFRIAMRNADIGTLATVCATVIEFRHGLTALHAMARKRADFDVDLISNVIPCC